MPFTPSFTTSTLHTEKMNTHIMHKYTQKLTARQFSNSPPPISQSSSAKRVSQLFVEPLQLTSSDMRMDLWSSDSSRQSVGIEWIMIHSKKSEWTEGREIIIISLWTSRNSQAGCKCFLALPALSKPQWKQQKMWTFFCFPWRYLHTLY